VLQIDDLIQYCFLEGCCLFDIYAEDLTALVTEDPTVQVDMVKQRHSHRH
jgi:hypothetical protein